MSGLFRLPVAFVVLRFVLEGVLRLLRSVCVVSRCWCVVIWVLLFVLRVFLGAACVSFVFVYSFVSFLLLLIFLQVS